MKRKYSHKNLMTSSTTVTSSIIILALLLENVTSQDLQYYDYNVNCGPQEVVVPTDPTGKYRFIPYNVKLHRCRGKDWDTINPQGVECVPVQSKIMKVEFKIDKDGVMGKIPLDNHTACTTKCKQKTGQCSLGQQWNTKICSCCTKIQECANDQIWDEKRCTCFCPSTSVTRCGEVTPPPPPAPTNFLNVKVKVKYVWFITIAEGVLLLALCLVGFNYYCYRDVAGSCCKGSEYCDGTSKASEKCVDMGSVDGKNEFCERERFLSF